ncbi:hypothetical protein CYLTODRAFT_445019 [Cylindrobasidium torrendii FP15055 ss-10]|uniref:Uncharacterized protein n=1 Tax=Cylindrobasidium torrendii FP15055 ss-10 TaxID=1314674 RepID=A0A0D7B8V8_9AGAR|nr:hypothetical protein CYLTODRAFT_445019 [Cylindrobasidium torrendii FP15055 ss-10]
MLNPLAWECGPPHGYPTMSSLASYICKLVVGPFQQYRRYLPVFFVLCVPTRESMQGLAKSQELRPRLRLNASLEASSKLAGAIAVAWRQRRRRSVEIQEETVPFEAHIRESPLVNHSHIVVSNGDNLVQNPPQADELKTKGSNVNGGGLENASRSNGLWSTIGRPIRQKECPIRWGSVGALESPNAWYQVQLYLRLKGCKFRGLQSTQKSVFGDQGASRESVQTD